MKNRTILLTLGLAVLVGAVFARTSLGRAQTTTPSQEPPAVSLASPLAAALDTIAAEEAATLATAGKYRQYPKTAYGNYDVEVHEYVTPSGEPGYQVFTTETRGGRTVRITSTGFGPEAADRTYDVVYPDPLSFATSTPAAPETAPAATTTP